MSVQITHHGEKRVRERMGLRRSAVERAAMNALERGIRHSDCRGALKRYIDALYFRERTATNMRIYADKVFLFRGETLITIVDVPAKYREATRKLASKRKSVEGAL